MNNDGPAGIKTTVDSLELARDWTSAICGSAAAGIRLPERRLEQRRF